jgi:DNA-binding MarR family transcriptional regulator
VVVELTDKGTERLAEAYGAANRRERQMLAGFTAEERRTLAELLARLLAVP